MRRLLIIALAGSCLACATQKKTSEIDTLETKVSDLSAHKSELYRAETITYGDTLQGENFIQLDDLQPLQVESTGQKVEIQLKPVRDAEGKLTGHRVVYKTIAKPKEIKKETLKTDSTKQVRQSTQENKKVAEHQTEKGSGLTSGLLGAALTLFLLLGLLLWWLTKR